MKRGEEGGENRGEAGGENRRCLKSISELPKCALIIIPDKATLL